MSEWTKGCGSGFRGPGVGEGCFSPHLPEAGRNSWHRLLRSQPWPHGLLTGSTKSVLGPVENARTPSALRTSSLVTGATLGRPWAAIKLFTPPPPNPHPAVPGVRYVLHGTERGPGRHFLGSGVVRGGWHPRTGSTKTGVLSEPAGKVLTFNVLGVDTPPPWPPFGPKLCHFKVTSKFSLNETEASQMAVAA